MRRALPFLLAAVCLAGCAELDGLQDSPIPDARPDPPAPVAQRSPESRRQEAFYKRVENRLLAEGLLRTDGGGPDVPFTSERLAETFLALAFSEEFSDTGGRVSARPRASTLHRWEDPVTIAVAFGDTVPADRAQADAALIDGYAGRLTRATGHPVSTSETRGNFAVYILHEQDIARIGPRLRDRLPGISDAEIAFVEDLPLDAYCVVFTSDPGNAGTITSAVAIIRAELPDRLRTACYHEELAQGLGLANDSDLARPSIFRDDDEFGRLTTKDELLLGILYDPRLAPGMTESDAAPLVRQIARGMMAPAT